MTLEYRLKLNKRLNEIDHELVQTERELEKHGIFTINRIKDYAKTAAYALLIGGALTIGAKIYESETNMYRIQSDIEMIREAGEKNKKEGDIKQKNLEEKIKEDIKNAELKALGETTNQPAANPTNTPINNEEKEKKQYSKPQDALYSKTPKIKNNNPGNLVYNPRIKWQGQIGKNHRFVRFKTLTQGLRAMGKNLQRYEDYGKDTVREIVNTWAPEIENDTLNYEEVICDITGYEPNQRLDLKDKETLANMIGAIAQMEHSAKLPRELVMNSIRDIN